MTQPTGPSIYKWPFKKAVTKLDHPGDVKTRYKWRSSLAEQPPLKALSTLMFIKPSQQLKMPSLFAQGSASQAARGRVALASSLSLILDQVALVCHRLLKKPRCFISSSNHCLEVMCEAHEVPVVRHSVGGRSSREAVALGLFHRTHEDLLLPVCVSTAALETAK